jgi:hypothetical protein
VVDSNRRPGYSTGFYKPGFPGGLYTQVSPLAVPDGYSPSMENVYINRRNNIHTRNGTQEILPAVASNSHFYVLRTKFGVTLLIIKQGTTLEIYRFTEVTEHILKHELIESFENVWSMEALTAFPSFTVLNSDRPRVVIATGTNAPVQLQFTERQVINMTASAVLTIQNSAQFSMTDGTIRVFRNGVLLQPSEYSFNGTQIILTSTLLGTFDILYIGWTWYTEAKLFYGFQLSQMQSRFNTGPSDLSVVTPAELILGIQTLRTDRTRLPIRLYKNGVRANEQVYANPPTTESDFTYSGGSFRTANNTSRVLPGITHVTFGAVNPTETDVSELTFIRGVSVFGFNGSDPLPASSYTVFVDENISAFAPGATLSTEYGSSYNGATTENMINQSVVTSDVTPIDYVLFTATESVGLRTGAVARVIRSSYLPLNNAASFIGNGALSTGGLPFTRAQRGQWWPVYGLSEHANFLNSSFPKYVETHENRLVFAGFPLNPTRIVLSSVLDTTVVGDFYTDFQVAEQEGLDVNAVIIDINSIDAGGITAIRSISGVLFAFTLNSVYLITGGDANLTPTRKFVTQVAGVGAVNASCVVAINNSLIFLSRSGIYFLSQSFDAAGGWRVSLLSEPVNDQLKNSNNISVAWMTFLPNEDTVYVAVAGEGSTTADTLLLWKQDVNAWTKFTDYTGCWHSSAGKFLDLSDNYIIMVKDGRLVSYPFAYPIDQVSVVDTLKVTDLMFRQMQEMPFRSIPDVGVNDVGSAVDTQVTKFNSKQLFIESDDPDNAFVYPTTIGTTLVVVYDTDHVRIPTEFDILTDTINPVPEAGQVFGYVYKCFVTTPTLFASSDRPQSFLPSVKTIHQVIFVFHTNGDYKNFGVSVKKIDTDPTQVTPINSVPETDGAPDIATDWSLFDAARKLVRPTWKLVVHPGGIEDFHQFIIMADSITEWELIALQSVVSQSGTRPGTGRI